MNKFHIWTFFQSRTFFLNEQISIIIFPFLNFFVKQLLSMNIFIMWTSFIYEHFFFMLTIFHINEHFYYVNKFHIWTFILMLTIFIFFHLWTFFKCEHIFHIWLISFLIILNVRTNFTFEQISYMIIFPSWTFFLNEQSSIITFFYKWTNFNYNTFRYSNFCKTIIINEHFYYVNKIHIWTFFNLLTHFSNMINFKFENKFHIWTNFIYEHFSLKNIFSKWTNFNYNFSVFNFFVKQLLLMNIFIMWTSFIYEHLFLW
jgi:hypothetical protein